MADRGVVFLTRFVCAPEKLTDAEDLYRRRVAEIDPRLAVVEASDDRALPIDDVALLWELRDTAVYEGIADVEKLELHQISSRLRLLAGEDDRITDQLFFADPAAVDPFPAEVTRLPTSKPAPSADGVALLSEGVWSVTVHALVPRVANAEDVFHDLRAGLDVAAASGSRRSAQRTRITAVSSAPSSWRRPAHCSPGKTWTRTTRPTGCA